MDLVRIAEELETGFPRGIESDTDYSRQSDREGQGRLSVSVARSSGNVYVSIGSSLVVFGNPFDGASKSPHTAKALLILAKAMKFDAERNMPQSDPHPD
ncbi:MAG: hypothetical protein A2556_00420 [Candidatus Vogelbacteria bacterium RIFOXYD2_FULL_44_9]|uniref:Uncharacterized protein n=1 Tax=Candidatus Vogelbacteria bacterium RIFOXYD2_FULL_44_9 TaxID=1802441 RepID=A0A1G2QJR6_9BACT|nr:MAG: hypothetical protein A2556_00420 [Candidatus Vogelbacteria bacterium RIFOXYD2_FULL_44_9]